MTLNKQLTATGLGIEWTHLFGRGSGHTLNSLAGCGHGCEFEMPDGSLAICYAKGVAERLASAAYQHGFDHAYWRPETLSAPLRVKDRRLGIFFGSMADIFWHEVPDDHIRQCLDMMREASWHVFFLLTKNAPRLLQFRGLFPPNVWVGVSMPPTIMFGKRLTAQQQWRWLHKAEAVLRDLEGHVTVRYMSLEPLSWDVGQIWQVVAPPLEWCIIGAASRGSTYFQPQPAWVERLHDVMDRAGIPAFHKGNLNIAGIQRREDYPATPRWDTWNSQIDGGYLSYAAFKPCGCLHTWIPRVGIDWPQWRRRAAEGWSVRLMTLEQIDRRLDGPECSHS